MYLSLRGTPVEGEGPESAAPVDQVAEATREATTAPDPGTPAKPTGTRASLVRGVPRTVFALGMVSLLTDISSESVSAVLPLYITAVLGMSPLAYGFLEGIYQGVSALVRLLGGWWADATQPKWVAFVGYLVSALSRLALLPATGFVALSAVVTVDRLGKGLRTGPRDAMIASVSAPERLGRNFGVHRTMDTFGALVGPLIAFAVLAAVPLGLGGYRSVFAISAAFAVIGVAVLLVVVPSRKVDRAAAPVKRDRSPRIALRLADLTTRPVRLLLVAAGLLSLVTVGDGFLYLALADGGGLSARYFPLLFVGTNAGYLLLALPMGRLADRIGRTKVLLAGHLALLGAYAFALSNEAAPLRMIGTLALLGTFYACTDGVLAALAAGVVKTSSRASGIAAAQTVVAVARFASAVAFGALWQAYDWRTGLVVMGVGMLVAVPAAAWLLHRSQAPVPETQR